MRVGTASQPDSVVAESEAASGELDFMMHEAAKLRKENAKQKRNMEALAAYSFGRFESLSAEAKEVKRLYDAARENCREGMVLPEAPAVQSQEPLRGKVFARMYEQAKELTIDEGSDDDDDEHSQNLENFDARSESVRSKKSPRTGASMSQSH